jgi:hypothetical protein
VKGSGRGLILNYYPSVCPEELSKKAQVTLEYEAGVPTTRTRHLLKRPNCRVCFTETQYIKRQTLHHKEHWQSTFLHYTKSPVQWVPRGSFPGGQVRCGIRLSPTATFSPWIRLTEAVFSRVLLYLKIFFP